MPDKLEHLTEDEELDPQLLRHLEEEDEYERMVRLLSGFACPHGICDY